MASLTYGFTCGGPGFDVSCTMDHYILGFSFLGCTQAIPGEKGYSHSQRWTFKKINEYINQNKAPVPIPEEVESVHG